MTETDKIDKTLLFLFENPNIPVHIGNLTAYIDDTKGADINRFLETLYSIGLARRSKNVQASMGANRDVYDYWIDTKGIHLFEELPTKYFNTPYSYYKEQELNSKKLNLEKVNLEIERLRNEFFDYAETKSRAKWAIRLSVLTLIVSALLGMMRLICNRPN